MINMAIGRDIKKQIRIEIGDLLDQHCKTCEMVPNTPKKSDDWSYCRTSCAIGKKINELGMTLLGEKPKKEEQKMEMTTLETPSLAVVENVENVEKPVDENESSTQSDNDAELTKERYFELIEQGMTTREIAKKYGINEKTLYYRKKKWESEGGVEKQSPEHDKELARWKYKYKAAYALAEQHKKENEDLKKQIEELLQRLRSGEENPGNFERKDTRQYDNTSQAKKRPETSQRVLDLIASIVDSQDKKGIEEYGCTIDDASDDEYDWQAMALEEFADATKYLIRENMKLAHENSELKERLTRIREAVAIE